MTLLQVITLMAVAFGLANGALCRNPEANGTLTFQSRGANVPILLINGLYVELECCVNSSASTLEVRWTFNGSSLPDLPASLQVSENQQVVKTLLAGNYTCVVSDGLSSMNKTFSVTSVYWDSTCQAGTVGEVKPGYPPKDLYGVKLHESIQLTCTAILYCGYMTLVDRVSWFKLSQDPEAAPLYNLYNGSLNNQRVDPVSGDFVNVSAWYADAANTSVVVQTVLTIRNVTENVLVDVPDTLTTGCQNSTTNSCVGASPKAYYQCFIAIEPSDDPSQSLYNLYANTMLHSSPDPSSAAHTNVKLSAYVVADNRSWEREGIIFGCLLGAFVLVVTAVALLYVKYEWHIRVYVQRLMIWRRAKGKGQRNYQYDCYIAGAREDEALIYGVLREQLEQDLGYRLCLPERDFDIGAAVPEQISSFIEKSEFFMAIISPRFWTTDWCSLAVDIALRTNAKVVVVFILDEPKTKPNKRADIAKALSAPGCSQIVFRSWKKTKGNDNLVLKLQWAMPKPRQRSIERKHQSHAPTNDVQLQQVHYLPSYESAVHSP